MLNEIPAKNTARMTIGKTAEMAMETVVTLVISLSRIFCRVSQSSFHSMLNEIPAKNTAMTIGKTAEMAMETVVILVISLSRIFCRVSQS